MKSEPGHEPVHEVSAIHLFGRVCNSLDVDDDELHEFSILLKVEKEVDLDQLEQRVQQIYDLVQDMHDESEDEEGDYELAVKFLLNFHEFSKHSDYYCFLVGELEDVVYPLVCALICKLFVPTVEVFIDTDEPVYGNTIVTLDQVSTYIQYQISQDFDWFAAIEAIEFPMDKFLFPVSEEVDNKVF